MMDFLLDATRDTEEPEWLETNIVGDLRLWQIMFLCFAGVTSLIVMVCCCFRFRIPRTKQQIEADYQRRQITTKFRLQLETIQDSKMDAMSLKDGSLEVPYQPEGGQKPEPQVSGMNFVKFATKVANLSKLGAPKSPTSTAPSANTKIDF